MRLSTAIALGRTLIRAVAGKYGTRDEGCAFGMAGAALGTEVAIFELIDESFPWTKAKYVLLPCGCKGKIVAANMSLQESDGHELVAIAIIHLFNHHVMTLRDWTLDQLIDFIASVEPAETEPASQEEPCVAVHCER